MGLGRLCSVLFGVAFVCVTPRVDAAYAFTPVALSDGVFDPFGFGAPVLNDAGRVAFNATLQATGDDGIFVGSAVPGSVTPIAVENGFSRFGDPTINSAGQVGFEASLTAPRGEGVFRGDGGLPVTIAGTRNAGDFDFVNAGPSINAAGTVAFIGETEVTFIAGVFAGNGGAVAPIYDETGAFDGFTGNPSLNDAGQAAFLAVLDSGVSGLFFGSGGAFTTVADDTGAFTSAFGFSDPSLNERGEVAFRAGTNEADPSDNSGSTAEGIFLYAGGVVVPIVHGDFSTFASLGDPSLNNLGTVAFLAEPMFGNQLLLTGPDLAADRVIGTGDMLLGRTVTGLLFSREGLNDRGELAFTAFFDDGSAGVFLASVASVPEPGTLALILAATALIRFGRRGFAQIPMRR